MMAVDIAPVAVVSSISPATGPSSGAVVTLHGTNFVNSSRLQCRFGTATMAPAVYVSDTEVRCVAPRLESPGSTPVALAVTNLGSKWSNPVTFTYVADNAGAKAFFGTDMMNTVKNALLPVL